MTTPEKAAAPDRLIPLAKSVRPAVEIDCSSWPTGAPAEQESTGRFMAPSAVRPPVEVDCSGWGVALELTLQVGSNGDVERTYFAVADLILHLSEYEVHLGGSGLTRDRVRSKAENGLLTIVLMPVLLDGAVDRMQKLSELVAHTTTELKVSNRVLPAA